MASNTPDPLDREHDTPTHGLVHRSKWQGIKLPGGCTRLLTMLFVNEDTPPGIKMKPVPEHAAIGQLHPGKSMEQVAAYLVEHDVPEDRIHFLSGEGGVSFLQHLGNWFSQVLSEGWTDARDALADGKVLVGVFDVGKTDATRIRQVLADAGIEHIRYFGTWTFE